MYAYLMNSSITTTTLDPIIKTSTPRPSDLDGESAPIQLKKDRELEN